MKLGDLVVLPEKKPIKSCGDCEYKHRMLEHGCNCSEAMDNLGFNLAIDIISQIEIPIAKILELVEIDVEEVILVILKEITSTMNPKITFDKRAESLFATFAPERLRKLAQAIASNKKDILKAVKP